MKDPPEKRDSTRTFELEPSPTLRQKAKKNYKVYSCNNFNVQILHMSNKKG